MSMTEETRNRYELARQQEIDGLVAKVRQILSYSPNGITLDRLAVKIGIIPRTHIRGNRSSRFLKLQEAIDLVAERRDCAHEFPLIVLKGTPHRQRTFFTKFQEPPIKVYRYGDPDHARIWNETVRKTA